jgi:hypothetical protein
MVHINPTMEQINEILKPGVKVKVDFESKKYNGIYQASGTVGRTQYGLVGFDQLETNYPPGIPEGEGLNTTRIRKIEILD